MDASGPARFASIFFGVMLMPVGVVLHLLLVRGPHKDKSQ